MRKLAWLVVLALGACSTTVTSVDGNKNVATLTPSDGDQLCKDIASYVSGALSPEEIVRIGCGFAMSDAGGSSCQANFDQCVKDANVTTTPIADPSDCDAFRASLKGCNVTVDQYTTCLQQAVDALSKLEQDVPFCSEQALETAAAGAEGDISSDCLTIFQTCSLSFGGTSTSSSGSSDGGSSGAPTH